MLGIEKTKAPPIPRFPRQAGKWLSEGSKRHQVNALPQTQESQCFFWKHGKPERLRKTLGPCSLRGRLYTPPWDLWATGVLEAISASRDAHTGWQPKRGSQLWTYETGKGWKRRGKGKMSWNGKAAKHRLDPISLGGLISHRRLWLDLVLPTLSCLRDWNDWNVSINFKHLPRTLFRASDSAPVTSWLLRRWSMLP